MDDCGKLSQLPWNPVADSIPDGTFLQFPLQGSSMHAERPCRGGNIAVVLGQDGLYMLPLESLDRWAARVVGRNLGCLRITAQRGNDVVDGGRFRQVLLGAFLYGVDGCRDTAIAGQDNRSCRCFALAQNLDERQPGLFSDA